MDKREQQLRLNCDNLFGEYLNAIYDDIDGYDYMTADEAYAYAKKEIYHIKAYGCGTVIYRQNICQNLKFLGHNKIKQVILECAVDVLKGE